MIEAKYIPPCDVSQCYKDFCYDPLSLAAHSISGKFYLSVQHIQSDRSFADHFIPFTGGHRISFQCFYLSTNGNISYLSWNFG